ncbi:hypothetical protein D9C73_013406 [Collichthys lucidus]|uniref:Uncharacterized protein n=1 Tax=Collichthys lucidus TaxID=240159 RepID=A0A4U5UZW3_COLLU|nr:hypothetical protein D9C73_013406 [Collichthys lucidus]
MHERCLMLRPRTQTSSPLAGRDAGTPCTTSCRVPPTPRDVNCPSPCPCPSCTSTQEGEMETTLRTARAPLPLRPTGMLSRGTANLPHAPASGHRVAKCIPVATGIKTFVQSGLVAGG